MTRRAGAVTSGSRRRRKRRRSGRRRATTTTTSKRGEQQALGARPQAQVVAWFAFMCRARLGQRLLPHDHFPLPVGDRVVVYVVCWLGRGARGRVRCIKWRHTPVDEVSQGGLLFSPSAAGVPGSEEARATAGPSNTCYRLPPTCAECEEQGKEKRESPLPVFQRNLLPKNASPYLALSLSLLPP